MQYPLKYHIFFPTQNGQPQPTLTVEQARLVLSVVIQVFSVPENSARMEEAREIIACFSYFSGVLKFARLVKMYETQDPEIAAISVKLGSLLLPPLPPYGTSVCILHLK
uniref:Protein C10 n=1 Tax=Oncorhynchus tshawytscha TaxID=74940 RepID=A0A8C8D7Y9_ONCTS